jgi:hypothetical protein
MGIDHQAVPVPFYVKSDTVWRRHAHRHRPFFIDLLLATSEGQAPSG